MALSRAHHTEQYYMKTQLFNLCGTGLFTSACSTLQVPKYFRMGSRRAGRVRRYVLLLHVLNIILSC